jgi:hypothetical protein
LQTRKLKAENQKVFEASHMSTYSFNEIPKSTDRHKVFILMSKPGDLSQTIARVNSETINTINIGIELANYIQSLDDYQYLNIDVFDHTKKLLDKHKTKIHGMGNDIVAIYNLGILMEPALELNAVQLLKEFSKSSALIIIWEHQSEIPDRLHWPTQKNNVFFDFSETQLKFLSYAV